MQFGGRGSHQFGATLVGNTLITMTIHGVDSPMQKRFISALYVYFTMAMHGRVVHAVVVIEADFGVCE